MVCYGKTSKKLENGVYHNESGTRLIEIKNDIYPYEVDLDSEKSIVIKLPNITDTLFSQYYLLGEYIQVVPHGIKWRGEYYKKF